MVENITEEAFDLEKWVCDMLSDSDEFIETKGDITKEWKCYLIGKYCENEKSKLKNGERIYNLELKISNELGYRIPTLRRFVSYYKAIDYLQALFPDVALDMLSGKIKISIEYVRLLAKKSHSEIQKTINRIKLGKERMSEIFPELGCVRLHKHNEEAANFANSYPPLLIEDYERVEKNISKEFKWYVIGLTCLFAREKKFRRKELNSLLTKEQIAKNSGYAANSMKHFVSYAKAIISLQEMFYTLAGSLLEGELSLSLQAVVILAKLPQDNISVILKRIKTENISIYKAIYEYNKQPDAFHKSVKNYSKSIKETPCYDPDAQVIGLTYTIPSWVKALNRAHMSANLREISKPTQNNLYNELVNLKSAVEALIEPINSIYGGVK